MTSATRPARRTAAAILVGTLAIATVGLVAAPPHTAPSTSARAIPPRPATTARPAPTTARPVTATPSPTAAPAPVSAPAPAPLVITHVIDTGGPIRYGGYFWNDAAPTAGPLTITVDLKASVLSVFRGGDEIGTAAVITGNDGKETPLGTFPIMAKDRHHVSKKYNAPMPYMLRLTSDGVSIHASAVAADYATHGCVGVPAGFAAKLFAVAKVGDRVIITNRGVVADSPPKAATT